jgi:DNA recombination protein RmuC
MTDMAVWAAVTAAVVTAGAAVAVILLVQRGRGALGREVREELRAGREEARAAARELREELAAALRAGSEAVATVQHQRLEEMARRLQELSDSTQLALERLRTSLDARVKELQEGNERKLDEMRRTVDEKLQDTLEKRLGESFKLVGDRLEAVHKGLGEMQNLASGVGDLKRVLTNVKARGTWAEVQLGALLDQILTPDQYAKNVCVKPGSGERVEFAVRLPGPKDAPDTQVWLPIDSKFPQEDYVRLQGAAERGEAEAVQAALEGLNRAVRAAARDIRDKYLDPPATTDFAIMFLATEGLYAEVLRQPALVEELQRVYRVVVAGPTTLAAILSSLRMGFQTLAIERRASEVWRILGAVKTEFGKFGQVLERVQRQLHTASRTLEETGVRSRALERRLRAVEQLPTAEAAEVLELPGATDRDDATGDGGGGGSRWDE